MDLATQAIGPLKEVGSDSEEVEERTESSLNEELLEEFFRIVKKNLNARPIRKRKRREFTLLDLLQKVVSDEESEFVQYIDCGQCDECEGKVIDPMKQLDIGQCDDCGEIRCALHPCVGCCEDNDNDNNNSDFDVDEELD